MERRDRFDLESIVEENKNKDFPKLLVDLSKTLDNTENLLRNIKKHLNLKTPFL